MKNKHSIITFLYIYFRFSSSCLSSKERLALCFENIALVWSTLKNTIRTTMKRHFMKYSFTKIFGYYFFFSVAGSAFTCGTGSAGPEICS